jgi:hypothetical protein
MAPEAPQNSVEMAEDVDWARARASTEAAALRAFLAQYPRGKHAREAAAALGELAYGAVKNSDNPQLLRRFAEEHPEHPFARTALSIARQLDSRAAAVAEIREVLARYTAAVQSMNLEAVAGLRELSKPLHERFKNLFHARRLEMKLVRTSPPEFSEPVVADPAGADAVPSRASVRSEWTMLVDSGRGDAKLVRQDATVLLNRKANGWIIAVILDHADAR